MGASNCASQVPERLSKCKEATGSCFKGSDYFDEYEPTKCHEANSESVEEAAVVATPTAAAHKEAEDFSSGESYFARELLELRSLKVYGRDGERPTYKFKTGATYSGQWKGNSRHGVGKQEWPDGAQFIGSWRENMAEGHGLFIHADGDVFTGQWKRNAAEGVGQYFHKRGNTTYMGEWVEDVQHGLGVEQNGGAKYEGQFIWGKKHGNGTYCWPDGSRYAGQWKANSINGYGHYIGKDRREFRGIWKDAVIHGCGRYTWDDGRTFSGQYVHDQKDGFGTFTWNDGRRFDGYWKEGKQNGFGVTYKPDGSILKQGIWEMGQSPAV